jgi:hypothetical protein
MYPLDTNRFSSRKSVRGTSDTFRVDTTSQ